MKISPIVRKALAFMATRKDVPAGDLAYALWPDSPGWNKVKNVGTRGAARAAMFRPAQGLLGKMRKAGLVVPGGAGHVTLWNITGQGRAQIANVPPAVRAREHA